MKTLLRSASIALLAVAFASAPTLAFADDGKCGECCKAEGAKKSAKKTNKKKPAAKPDAEKA